jgi:membrane fusion protein, multidrug efflux system
MRRLSVIISAFMLIIMFSCTQGTQKSSETTGTAAVQPKVEIVRTMPLNYEKVSHSVEYAATLLGYEEVHLAPASPGRIDEIYVEAGSRVSKGTVLVQMDKTQLHQAEIQLRTIETDFKRLDTLKKVGSVAQQQYDQIKAQYEIAKNNVAFLTDNTRLKAPFSGVVSGKYFEPGEMYSGAPVVSVGKAAILSLVQIDRLKLIVGISEKYYPQIKNNMTVAVKCDIYPEKSYTGKVFRIYPTIDPSSHSFSVEVSLDNRDNNLRPGMFCRVTIDLEQVEAIMLPAEAVLKMQGSNDRYLFIEKDGKAKRIAVNIGNRFNDKVEVISEELKQGDQVVINGQARLLDGALVKVVND